MHKKILITGCSGFIGFHLTKKLADIGCGIIGLDSMNDYYDVLLKKNRLKELNKIKNFSFFKIDISDSKEINILFNNNKIDYVIHLAAQAGVRYSIENPHAYIDSNITGFINILEQCKNFNINLIYASSSSVYGDCMKIPFSEDEKCDMPISLYGASKRFNEMISYTYKNLFNVSSIGLRFFTVYGPWGRPDMAYYNFTKNILNDDEILVYNKGNHSRSFTFIDDIIQSIVLLLQNFYDKNNYYEIVNIGGDQSVSVLDFIKIIENSLNKRAKIKFAPKQLGDVKNTSSDCSKLYSLIDFSPSISLSEGMQKFTCWYKKYYKL